MITDPAELSTQSFDLIAGAVLSRGKLRLAIVTWIGRTYHRRRRQQALGGLTLFECETLLHVAHAA